MDLDQDAGVDEVTKAFLNRMGLTQDVAMRSC